MWLLEDPGQFGGAVVFHHEVLDVTQNLRHQLHVVILHRLQLHLLLLLMSLKETEQLREGRRSSSLLAFVWMCTDSKNVWSQLGATKFKRKKKRFTTEKFGN